MQRILRSQGTMFKRHLVILIGLLVTAVAHSASAQKSGGGGGGGDWANTWDDATPGQLIGTPVYDPEAKRYFALMHTAQGAQSLTMWESVAEQARRQSYKGVSGRLAIVDSAEIHGFLLRTFRPNPVQDIWIGLRYLCRAKKLEWSDGKLWQPGSFQNWDANWNQDPYTCSDKNNPNDWAPVVYQQGMRSWVVKGNHKGYHWYFIEYPTGHE